MTKPNIELTYFYMEGCPYCIQFDPIWKELCDKLDEKIITTNKFEKEEKDNNDISKNILKEYGKPVQGYPTILVKINDKFFKYTGNRTVEDIINFIIDKLKKNDKIYDYLDSLINKNTEIVKTSDNSRAELIYFYMNGCHYCEQFNPVWNEFCKNLKENLNDNLNDNLIKTQRFSSHEIENRDTPQRILTEYGQEINGFPTVLLKVDDKFHMFDRDRTVKSLAEFIMSKLDENNKLYKFLNEKFAKVKADIKKEDDDNDNDINDNNIFNCNTRQSGGKKNIDYRNKYKKYKQMYAELAIKYNKLKKTK